MHIKSFIKRTDNKQLRFFLFSRLKRGGVALTFDDNFVDAWHSIGTLLNDYDAKATFFISFFDRLDESKIEKLKVLQSHGHEIACHGLRHLNAVEFVGHNSVDQYLEIEIKPAIRSMKSRGFHPSSFSYPYGAHSNVLDKALLNFFDRIRTSSGDNSNYYSPKQRVVGGMGIDNIYKNSDKLAECMLIAKKRKTVLILYGHHPSNEPGDYHTPIDRIEFILNIAQENEIDFYRMCDL